MMRVLSVNVGSPKQIQLRNNRTVLTSIFKSPVEGRVAVRPHNIAGDRQSDLTVHGGPYKAVYCYPGEHYSFWNEQLPGMNLAYGIFGENLTTEAIIEDAVYIGDQFRFGRADLVKKFWQSGRSGIYFSVVEEGDVAAGDLIERTARGPEAVSVADVVKLYRGDDKDPQLLERALRAPLSGGWKKELLERREQLSLYSE
jgi:MOSC domain-containing protein YiiM